jgi:DNA-directed RNA polymerase subunit RPC12/RpoP
MDYLIFALIVWIFCGIGATLVASNRGANGSLWFVLGFLLGPFGLAASFMAGENAECPSCRKRVHPKAEKCSYCQTQLTIECPSCHHRIHPKSEICSHCQTQLVTEETPPQEVVLGVPCPKCGFRNDATWRFCGSCSEPLTSKTTSPDLAEQIERLADLYSKGLLSEDEFRKAKAKLLG